MRLWVDCLIGLGYFASCTFAGYIRPYDEQLYCIALAFSGAFSIAIIIRFLKRYVES